MAQTWRPADFTPGCVEIYSTGNANIPGTKSHYALLEGFGRLVPRLLQYSSSALDRAQPDPNAEYEGVCEEVAVADDSLQVEDDKDLWEGWAERE